MAREPQSPDARLWLGVGALVLTTVTLLTAARRSSRPGELAFSEIPGVVGWLFLALLTLALLAGGAPAGGPTDRRSTLVMVQLPLAAAAAHTAAWWTERSELQVAASFVLAASLVAFLARWITWRARAGPLVVAELGALVAFVLLAGTVVMEAAAAMADRSSRDPAAILDARGPSVGAVAVVVGMGLAEAGLGGARRVALVDIAGTFQMLLFGIGWTALVAGSALDSVSLQVTWVGLLLLSVVVFLVRVSSRVSPALALAPAARWSSCALLAAAAYMGLVAHVVVGLGDGRYADSAAIPPWLEIGIDVTALAGLAGNGVISVVLRNSARPIGARQGLAVFVLFEAGLVAVVISGDAVWAPRIAWTAMALATAAVAWLALHPRR